MARNDYETSQSAGQPVELFLFTYGTAPDDSPLYYAYTDGETEVVHDGITYTPLAIENKTELRTTGKPERAQIEIEVPRTSDVAGLFIGLPVGNVVAVKIRRGHIPNPDDPGSWASGENFPVAWTGQVIEPVTDGAVMSLTCWSSADSMKRVGLRRRYQWACPLVLYGPRCGASKAAATTSATVSAVNGNKVTITGSFTPENYVGGLVEWQGTKGPESRSIRRISGNEFTLDRPVVDLAPSDTVDVVYGCPRTFDACAALHNNAPRFGGQPFIPTENPVGKNNHT